MNRTTSVRSLRTRSVAVVVGLAAVPVLAACSSNASSSTSSTSSASGSASGGGTINVMATDTTCDISTTTTKAGQTTFAVSNKGSQETEVYVYGKEGDSYSKTVAEVEHIGPGVSRSGTADLAAGTYEIACKPGEVGNGIRATLTVTAG